uniref:Lipase 3b n=1 Tax=Lygus lineolaris TaxID=50650 RepID=A0A0U1XPI8_LYGLI|nr:lipase 3b [Lygus lineolaris]
MTSLQCLIFAIVLIAQAPIFEARTAEDRAFLMEEAGKMLFQLYTRDNPTKPWDFELNDLTYMNFGPFNHSKPTKILTHGWNCYWGSAYNILMKNALLIGGDVNVIVVSWDLSSTLGYFGAKKYVPTAGRVVALMIDLLVEQSGLRLEDAHVIGHSLGAHVAGIAGMYITTGRLPRVTGLDPAGPFYSKGDEMRISKNSAEFVDIIHTAKWIEGIHDEVGHVDFYPNGGYPFQPGCGWDIAGFRSHRRAYWLFASSVLNPGGFLAVQCDNWHNFKNGKCKGNNVTEMGQNVSPKARGKYFLRTGSKMPYALGESSISYN